TKGRIIQIMNGRREIVGQNVHSGGKATCEVGADGVRRRRSTAVRVCISGVGPEVADPDSRSRMDRRGVRGLVVGAPPSCSEGSVGRTQPGSVDIITKKAGMGMDHRWNIALLQPP